MHDRGKSDGLVVPAKPPNNAGRLVAEAVEGRGPAEGNAASKTRAGRRAGHDASSALDRVRRPAIEDKILQRAVVEVLKGIYEADFLGFSYGFRAGRSAHDALDALVAGIYDRKVNWVLDADIRDFFGSLDHGWMMRFLEHRVGDRRVLRLIQKWLAAGVIEDGAW